MAEVTLGGANQQVTQELPHVCICCGAPADLSVARTFHWLSPRTAYVFIPLVMALCAVLPGLIFMFLLRKTMRVHLPLCHRHRQPWLFPTLVSRSLAVYVLAPFLVGYFIVGSAGPPHNPRAEPAPQNWEIIAMVVAAYGTGLVGLAGLAITARRSAVHPTEITDESITLGAVSKKFAAELAKVPYGRYGQSPFFSKGLVSVWLGSFPNQTSFDDYLRITDDGDDNQSCPFWEDFGVEYLDHEFQESFCSASEEDRPLEEILAMHFSHLKSFRRALAAECELKGIKAAGAVVFQYDCAIRLTGAFSSSPYLQFVGVFPYSEGD